MNQNSRNIIIFFALFVLGPLFSNLNDAWADRSGKRMGRQHERISKGVENGSLTRKEARGLSRSGKKIREYRKEAREDGSLSGKEKYKLERMSDKRSKRIYKSKHDDQNRGEGAGRGNSGDAENSTEGIGEANSETTGVDIDQ